MRILLRKGGAMEGKKELRILAVCGMGLGSGLVLKMTLEKVLKDLGVKARVEVSDIGSASSMQSDLIVTSEEFGKVLEKAGVKIITIKNYVDYNEMKQKITEALKGLKQ